MKETIIKGIELQLEAYEVKQKEKLKEEVKKIKQEYHLGNVDGYKKLEAYCNMASQLLPLNANGIKRLLHDSKRIGFNEDTGRYFALENKYSITVDGHIYVKYKSLMRILNTEVVCLLSDSGELSTMAERVNNKYPKLMQSMYNISNADAQRTLGIFEDIRLSIQ